MVGSVYGQIKVEEALWHTFSNILRTDSRESFPEAVPHFSWKDGNGYKNRCCHADKQTFFHILDNKRFSLFFFLQHSI